MPLLLMRLLLRGALGSSVRSVGGVTSSLTRRVPTKLAVVRKYLLSPWAWVMKPPLTLAMAESVCAEMAWSVCGEV